MCKAFDSKIGIKLRENFDNNQRINLITDEETFVLCSAIKVNAKNFEFIQQSDYTKDFYDKKIRNIITTKKLKII